MIVVSDSTPLITLMKVARLQILKELFGEIIVPEAVHKELTSNVRFSEGAQQINSSDFIRVISVEDRKSVSLLQRAAGLDLGESELIIYAENNKADLLLVDEASGRRVARSMGIEIMGSVGVLVSAFREGILSEDEASDAFQRIREVRRHISERLIEDALNIIHGIE